MRNRSYQILMYNGRMPKRFSIQPSLSLQDVKRCYRGAKAPVVRRHWPIIWLLAHGRTADQGAASTGDRVKGIRTVAPRYNQNGPAGLGDLRPRNPGQPGLLSAAPRQALATALDRAAPGWRALDWPQRGGLDGGNAGPAGASAAGLGAAAAARGAAPSAAAAPCEG
jgi:hypothetical protein